MLPSSLAYKKPQNAISPITHMMIATLLLTSKIVSSYSNHTIGNLKNRQMYGDMGIGDMGSLTYVSMGLHQRRASSWCPVRKDWDARHPPIAERNTRVDCWCLVPLGHGLTSGGRGACGRLVIIRQGGMHYSSCKMPLVTSLEIERTTAYRHTKH